MFELAGIYKAHFKTWTAVQLQYRVAMIIWLIGLVIEPVTYLVVWTTVARNGGGTVGGYSAGDLAAWFIASMVVNHLTFTWHMWEYDYIIRQGLLSPRLLRPLHPIHSDLAENLAYKTITLIVIIPTTIALILIFRPTLNPPLWSLLAFFPALAMAFFVQFMIGWAVAMTAFWTTRVEAINRVYFLGKLFLAGQIAPLSLLPPALQTLAAILPYRWMLAFPIELLTGQLSPAAAGRGLLIQVLWVIGGAILARTVWRLGIRRYAAFGA
ncbi:MAG: ABC transporter permease [Chloroflexi bacterium]|nr:MAG: ABC transporter permease [Chloroflexota bacterium]